MITAEMWCVLWQKSDFTVSSQSLPLGNISAIHAHSEGELNWFSNTEKQWQCESEAAELTPSPPHIHAPTNPRLEQHKEMPLYSVGNTVSLAQKAAGTSSIWPLTPSEAKCNHYRHVQFSLCHCAPLFPASSKLLPIISHPRAAPAANCSCRALRSVQLSCRFA